MNIAIDYDDTYTLSPDVWNQIIDILLKQNNNVYCVTKRYAENAEDIVKTFANKSVPIIYAVKSKLEAVSEAGIKIDIWIDDKPQSIYPYRLLNKNINRRFRRW
tara:strand:+ start:779 stop:1090 length:312 start_codon:yes stop_codon:yes gene_type:complete